MPSSATLFYTARADSNNNKSFPADEFCDELNGDMNYDFMDQKPGIGRKGGKKGRRHAGEALIQRQISNQAYLIKKCDVEPAGKQCGKKRRARLLSDHMSDFNLSVPYSLNRKNRWDLMNTEEYAHSLADKMDESELDGRTTIAESEFAHNEVPGERLKSYHLITGPGALTSCLARSSRGAIASGFLPKSSSGTRSGRDENALPPSEATPHMNVEYLICKPHPKMFASKYFKGRNSVKSMRRAALELICGNGLGQPYSKSKADRVEDDNELFADDTSNWNLRESTYTLADFVKEISPPPVFIKTPEKRNKIDPETENQFNMVMDPNEGVVEIDEYKQEQPSFVCDLLEIPKIWTFLRFNTQAAKFGIDDHHSWLEKCQHLLEQPMSLDFQWNNQTESSFSLDLTQLLLRDTNQRLMKPLLVLAIAFSEGKEGSLRKISVLVNSVFCAGEEGSKLVGLKSILEKTPSSKSARSFMELVKAAIDDFRPLYEQSLQGSEASEESHFKNDVNSHRLAHAITMASVYQMMEMDAQKHAAWEHQFVGPEELFMENGGDSKKSVVTTTTEGDEGAEEEADEFELIDFSELVKETGEKGELSEMEEQDALTPLCCEACGENNERSLHQLQSCGHRYCSGCLTVAFNQILKTKRVPLQCLNSNCGVEVPLGILRSFLPLPLLNNYVVAQFSLEHNMTGVAKCPNCKEVACLDQMPTFGQVVCGQCASIWCVGCNQRPHWPLTCAQSDEWLKKFASQYSSLQKDPSALETIVGCEKQQRSVAQQFFSISSQSFVRRFDSKQGIKLAKAMGRHTDYKVKRQFVELRKMALHLIEFGNAWLFLNRGTAQKRSLNWGQIKQLLTTLRDHLDTLENEILFTSEAIANAGKITEKVKLMEQSTEKLLGKFMATN